jgi:hypothetical protein
VWPPNEWVLRASRLHHVPYQILLAVVGGQDADLVRRVAQQTHEAAGMKEQQQQQQV